MTSLARRERYSFGDRATATRLELRLGEGLDFDEWQRILARVVSIGDSSAWWIGDALAYGEWRYGTKYRTVLEDLELTYDQARMYAYVAGNVPATVRRGDLSFTHHRVVAKLVPVQQEKWLKRAADEHWTVQELRDQLARELAPATQDAVLEQLRISVDRHRLERYQAAAERADATVNEWAIAVLDAEAER